MFKNEYPQELWQTWPSIHNGNSYIVSVPYSGKGSIAHCESPEIARRIVACVNACAGVSTDALERSKSLEGFMVSMKSIEKQRDSLVSVINQVKLLLTANTHSERKIGRILDSVIDNLDRKS